MSAAALLAVSVGIVDTAIQIWQDAGLSSDMTASLEQVEFRIMDLPGSYLGHDPTAVVWIDANADGFGWFIDPTPWDDEELFAKLEWQ